MLGLHGAAWRMVMALLLLRMTVPADATCRLAIGAMDAWCEDVETQSTCTMPCMIDGNGACRFLTSVQKWFDPCFYATEKMCTFPCTTDSSSDDDGAQSGHPPSLLGLHDDAASPPPPRAGGGCRVSAEAPHLVETWWGTQCLRFTNATGCRANAYCVWHGG